MRSTPGRVIVVDDDKRLLLLIRLVLVEEGLVPFTFSEGQLALDAVASTAPNAIVLDLEMPVMTGREFYKRLRTEGHTMPVLILSALDPRRRQREIGAEASMKKPFNSTELARRVAALAASHASAGESATPSGSSGSASMKRVRPASV